MMRPFEMFEVWAISFALALAVTTSIQFLQWLVSSIENQVAKKWRTPPRRTALRLSQRIKTYNQRGLDHE